VLISELRFITCDYGTTFTQVYPVYYSPPGKEEFEARRSLEGLSITWYHQLPTLYQW